LNLSQLRLGLGQPVLQYDLRRGLGVHVGCVIVDVAWLKGEAGRGAEGANVVVDEQILVLPRVDGRCRVGHRLHASLERGEVVGLKGRGL
jgi:hypothetical protein